MNLEMCRYIINITLFNFYFCSIILFQKVFVGLQVGVRLTLFKYILVVPQFTPV